LCPVKSNWHRINAAIREALEKISLAEMAQPLSSPLVNLTERSPIQEVRVS
jgi:DNA-binding IscR family transcriptional regulator